MLARSLVRALVGDEQLDRVPEDGVRELGRGGERLVLVAECAGEEVVDRGEHLRARAVVAREREQVRGLRSALAEDLDVRVPEAVDRLELVADREHLRRLRVRREIDELALEPVRVLELVDHDQPEAEPDGVAHALVVAQEVPRGELEILEVDDGLAALGRVVLAREPLEQLLEELAIVRGELLERRLLDRLSLVLVRRRPRAAAFERGQVDHALGRRRLARDAEHLGRRAALEIRRRRVRRRAPSPPRRSRAIASASGGCSPSSSTSGRPAERSVS